MASAIDPELAAARWRTVTRTLDELIDLPPSRREAHLDQVCADDEGLRAELESLLAAMDRSEAFLETAALGAADDRAPATAAFAGASLGLVLGPWQLQALLGRGGMGEVYLAQRIDGQFEQRAAVKLIRSDIEVSTPRFLLERQIVAGLQHPGIARLLDGGLAPDGRPYMVMEYVEGLSLREHCAQYRPTLDQRLALFGQIAAAVAFAHRHLVVHRDLKPANVRVDERGQARLLDFGIAKLIQPSGVAPAQTQALLTPESAAPEVLTGGAVTAATDVYGLGLILHELLCGQSPVPRLHPSLAIAVRQLLDHELPPPSAVGRLFPAARLRGDLDAITAKALRHDPRQRYPGAEALLDDLHRHQAGEAVLARGDGGWYPVSRFLRRHRLAVAAACAVLVSLTLGAAGIAWQAREAAVQRDRALDEAARSRAVTDYLLHMFRVAGEDPAGESISAREVLAQAAARVREEFGSDPAAARETLLALGDLYFQMGDPDGAEALFDQALELGADAPEDAGAEAMARQRLAEIRFDPADPEPARALLRQAQALWSVQPQRYREALQNSRIVEAMFEREAGAPARAAALLEPVAQRLQAQGDDAETTGVVLNELGSAQADSGRIETAVASYRAALVQFDRAGLSNSSNAAITLNNLCGGLYLLEQFDEALRCVDRSLDLRLQLYGPSLNSAAVEQQRALILLALERPAEALAAVATGQDMIEPLAARDSAIRARLLLTRLHGLTAAGRHEEAALQLDELDELLAVHAGLSARFRPLLLVERARLHRARGEHAAALQAMEAAGVALAAAPRTSPDDLLMFRALRRQLGEQTADPGG